MGKMGCTPILSIKVSIKNIKGAAYKNSEVDGTCKRSPTDDIILQIKGMLPSNCYDTCYIL